MFATDTYDLKPDFITVAKALSSAYLPISGVMMTQQVFDGISKQSGEVGVLGHGFTYSGHPAAAAVALETLKIYEERDILGHIASVSGRLQDGIRRFANHPLRSEERRVGKEGVGQLRTGWW